MCGIVGYTGQETAGPILLEGLKRLEYRGYDSAGLVLILPEGRAHFLRKCPGRISSLEEIVASSSDMLLSTCGIAHTRWATHGEPNEVNAHPHSDCEEKIFVVHNGIIENFRELKKGLLERGHQFRSETDTEVLAHLIEEYFKGDLKEAVQKALRHVVGSYGLAVVSRYEPDKIVAARLASPLVVGVTNNGSHFVASDVAAFARYTKRVIHLEDGQMAVLKSGSEVEITNLDNVVLGAKVEEIDWDVKEIDTGGYPHFMLKEIYEQPRSLADTLRGRLKDGQVTLGGLSDYLTKLQEAKRFFFLACGTSYHAALVGQKVMKDLLHLPVDVEYASEFRYDYPALEDDTVFIVISQSGETADTLAALKRVKEYRKEKGLDLPVLGIVNVYASSIARETDAGIYLNAGPEIGVASTKAFTSQLAVILLITLKVMELKGLDGETRGGLVSALRKIPRQVEEVLALNFQIEELARQYHRFSNFYFLGRRYSFPVALEGALKLKEISYVHAEGYPAAEMKHGPIALIDENMPVVVVAPRDAIYDKVVSNIQEVKARKGQVIAVVTQGDEEIRRLANHVIQIPETLAPLTPLLSVIPLQLFAYHMAVLKGLDVDKPRNLAKSVTVE